jgi:hypothetical protein
MVNKKRGLFSKYRIKRLLGTGMSKEKDEPNYEHIQTQLKCDSCGKFSTLFYEYEDRSIFLGRDKPLNNNRYICTCECNNCGEKKLTNHPLIATIEGEQFVKTSKIFYDTELDKENLLKYDVYDDCGIVIK